MQKSEYSKFATPIKSKGRIFGEKSSSFRSPYQRDRDRIVHSTAFRRLKHKTQVFVNTIDDHYRTRLTHSLRTLTLLENKYYSFAGLNLTLETLDGLIKHNGPVHDKSKFDEILGKNIFKNKIIYKNNPSLEAQISTISDDIAYNSHDLEDGLKAKLFNINDLVHIPVISEIVQKHKKKIKSKDIELIF